MNKNKKMLVEGENMEKIDAVYVGGKVLYLEIPPQLDNSGYGEDGVAFFSTAHDEEGNRYKVRWDYIEPDWHKDLEPFDDGYYTNDLSDFADWEHPAEVKEV